MDINWLSGGPYFEISILTDIRDIDRVIALLPSSGIALEFAVDDEELRCLIEEFRKGMSDNISLNARVEIAGKRRARLFYAILSDELAVLDIWLLGDEFSKPPITDRELPKMRRTLQKLMNVFNAPAGTIGWEEDATSLIQSPHPYPHQDYCMKGLSEGIRKLTGAQCPQGIVWWTNKT